MGLLDDWQKSSMDHFSLQLMTTNIPANNYIAQIELSRLSTLSSVCKATPPK